jgi:adenylate cyclase
VFGAPVTNSNDAARAVESAIAMQKKAMEIDKKLNQKGGLRLKIGIGIATGKVFSGVLGSLRKKEFTSIGMAVNIASRLQNMAVEVEIIISENTFQNISEQKIAGQIDATALTPVKVKGIDKPITLYRINF